MLAKFVSDTDIFVSDTDKDWDKWLPYLLFAYCEVLFTHQVRGPLNMLRDSWEIDDKSHKRNLLSYVLQMRDKLQQAVSTARDNLQQAQRKQKTMTRQENSVV